MLEKIQAYSQRLNQKPASPSTQNALMGIDLAAISVRPSRFLWQAQMAIYILILVFSFIALLPFFGTAFYWILLWFAFSLVVGIAIGHSFTVKNAAPMCFEIKQDQWRLTTPTGVCVVTVNGDVLLWSWLIVIPLRENLTGKQQFLIALPDSFTPSEWRLLRVWLKTCLYKMG